MGNFKELLVWQKAVELVTDIYSITEHFPNKESFGLTSQIRRSSISIPSNIAEGNSRRSSLDYIQFLKIARGSLAELETQIIISQKLKYLDEETYEKLSFVITEIGKMLNSLIRSINQKLNIQTNPQSLKPNS